MEQTFIHELSLKRAMQTIQQNNTSVLNVSTEAYVNKHLQELTTVIVSTRYQTRDVNDLNNSSTKHEGSTD